jgi:hypothetical protein
MSDEALEERLRVAREEGEKRRKAREEKDQLRELLVLDLEARYEAELGPRGAAFQIEVFEDLDKVVALKRPDRLVVKRYDDACKKKIGASEEDQVNYVTPSILYPPLEEWKEWRLAHPSIVIECIASLRQLEGLRIKEQLGKLRP